MNLWFTQCKPCVEEIPALNKIKKQFNDKINFVSLTFNSKEEVLQFLEIKQFDFFHLVDAGLFINDIGVKAFPINILIDKNGIVQSIEEGIPFMQNEKGEFIKFDDSDIVSKLELLLKI